MNDQNKELVIAGGGSSTETLHDLISDFLLTDALQMPIIPPVQLYEAREAIELFKIGEGRNYLDYSWACVGHSLGGALAEFVGQSFDLPILTVGAPHLPQIAWDDIIVYNPTMEAKSIRIEGVRSNGISDLVTYANLLEQGGTPNRNRTVIQVNAGGEKVIVHLMKTYSQAIENYE